MPQKKITKRKKSPKALPLLEALPVTHFLVDPPKPPKPQNAADAWDAMKAAGELPYGYLGSENPYRAEKDRADEAAKTAGLRVCTESADVAVYNPTRHFAPDVHQSSHLTEPLCPQWEYNGCPHLLPNGTSAIQWMQHSNHIITGTCAHCPTRFDTRHEAHLELLLANPKAVRNMGRANQSNTLGTGRGQVYGTRWQIFVYNHFAWVYSVKVWLRNSPAHLRKVWVWMKEDFGDKIW